MASGEKAATAAAATDDRPFVCEFCGKTYGIERALKRHLSGRHGAPISESAERRRRREAKERGEVVSQSPRGGSVADRARASITSAVAGLQKELGEIEARLEVLANEQGELRVAKTQIVAAIRRLDPEALPKKEPSTPQQNGSAAYHDQRREEKAKEVETFLNTHPYPDGFTTNRLIDDMREFGGQFSSKTMTPIVESLHQRGIIRADRIVKGGGRAYMLVGANEEEKS